MIGNDIISSFFDNLFAGITDVISTILTTGLSVLFINNYVAIIIFLIIMNILTIVLMKRDKQYAQIPGAKRIRESTLLLAAIVGGAMGEYYAMYKYKHKTLHKKFLYGVPIAIMFHFALISYNIFVGILA